MEFPIVANTDVPVVRGARGASFAGSSLPSYDFAQIGSLPGAEDGLVELSF